MAKARIIVVEDEAIVALDVRTRLQQLGYEVLAVLSNGEDAIACAERERPDLFVMDVMLEGKLDGIEAAEVIKRRFGTPVVYLTAYADQQTLNRAKITEPFGYIIKPFEDRELAINVEMALYKHGVDRQLHDKERWLATTLDSIADGVITADATGKVQFINPAAAVIVGCGLEEAPGRDLSTLVSLSHDFGVEVGASLANAVRGDGCRFVISDMHTSVIGPERNIPINAVLSPIAGDNGDGFKGSVLVLRDVTERKRAESALEQSVCQLKTALEDAVKALAATSEKRDPYTAGHQQRVAQLAAAMGEQLSMAKDSVEGIRVSATLHDLGKIYVPAEILSKPARLTSMEMGIMKTHSEVGYDILKNIQFPWPVADIVLQHHERMDGSGYPQGLGGADILPEARVLAVADVVEAMSSHRPYRPALGLSLALEEIETGRGRLYDPDAVDSCLELFRARSFEFDDFGS